MDSSHNGQESHRLRDRNVKKCKDCGERKPLDEFYKASGTRDGHRNDCKKCNLARRAAKYRENPRPYIERAQKWQRDNPERHAARQREYVESGKKSISNRKSHLKRNFGMTLEDFEQMLEAQGGGCAICGNPDADNIDHDHQTGRVRGILCFTCNAGLGLFVDSEDRLAGAIDYVLRTADDELTGLARTRALALIG